MFTLNIRDIVAVGKSEMKWVAKEVQVSSNTTSEEKAAEQAMKNIQDYKGNDEIVLARLVRDLHSANEDFAKKNAEKSAVISTNFVTAISNEMDPKKRQILEELQKERAEKAQANNVAKSNIIENTQAATAAAVPVKAPVVSENGAISPSETNSNKFIFTDKDFNKAFNRSATQPGQTKEIIYSRIVGEAPGSPMNMELLQQKTNASLVFLQQLGAGNAGLNALLYGQTEKFMKTIAAKVQDNGGKPLEINVASLDGISPTMQNIAGALVTTGVAVVTGGLVTAGHEAHDVQAQSIMDQISKNMDPSLLSRLGKGLNWVKEAFMGRKLSFTLGEERVINYNKKVLEYAENIMKLDEKGLTSGYPDAVKIAQSAGFDITTPSGKEAIQKALIQSYILGEGYKAEGSNWQANIGLFFIGAGRDQILVKRQSTTESAANTIERAITKREVSTEEIVAAGVSIDNKGGKWEHTIPATLKLSGDTEALDVVIVGATPVGGKYVIAQDKVADIHFSDINGKYVVTLTDRKTQPVNANEDITPKGDLTSKKQDVAAIKNIRNSKEKQSSTPGDSLYNIVGHSDKKAFAPLITALASQDANGVSKALTVLKGGKYANLAKALEKDMANADGWTSYMYGTAKDRVNATPEQKSVDAVRTQAVIDAETRLAKSVGITWTTDENQFKLPKGQKHTPVQASAEYPGQEMTLSVFATPSINVDGQKTTGVHRIDTLDGSVAISQKSVIVTDPSYKSQIVDATLNKVHESHGIKSQLTKLNLFLVANKKPEVKLAQYVQYLKDGDISKLGVEGLKTQDGKGTKIFEGRAMIAGNVCMNRIHGIGYPVFELPGTTPDAPSTKQPVTPAGTMDASASLDVSSVETRQSALGISPLAVAAKLSTHKTTPGKPDTPTTPTTPAPTPTPAPVVPGTPVRTPGVVTTPIEAPVVIPTPVAAAPAAPVTGPVVAAPIKAPIGSTGPVAK